MRSQLQHAPAARVPFPTRRLAVGTSTILTALISASAHAQQAYTIGPFVAYSTTSTAALAGLGAGASLGPLTLRASGYVPATSVVSSAGSTRPLAWGGDADALLSLGGASLGGLLTPYVLVGASALGDTGSTRGGWSYGGGLSLNLLSAVSLFGESRQRMSGFVLPGAPGAPSPTSEFRLGLSLRFGGGRSRASAGSVAIIPAGAPVGGSGSGNAARVIPTAEEYLGVPYRWGGTSPNTGFDCSGFTQYVFAKHGVRLPRTSREQAQVGQALRADWRAVSAGDLVMFEENGRIGHVAIYAGNGRIIHSSSSGHGVRFDDLSTQRGHWFRDHMVAARRVAPDNRGLLLDLARGFADGVGLVLDPPDNAPKPR